MGGIQWRQIGSHWTMCSLACDAPFVRRSQITAECSTLSRIAFVLFYRRFFPSKLHNSCSLMISSNKF